MDLLQFVFLGILQGLFEWLPISSQGQVVGIATAFLNIAPQAALEYAIFLHTGTLLAAIVYFKKELIELIKNIHNQKTQFLIIAVAATLITGVPIYFGLKSIVFSSAILLFLIAILLFATGFIQTKAKSTRKPVLSAKNAVLLGLFQGLAILPGISRSGITTSVLLFRGFSPEESFKLSFLLSIPTVLIAEIGLGAIKGFFIDLNALLAVLVSFIVGLITIDWLIKLAKRISFSTFCYGFGIFYLILALFYLFPF
jgi:undecaprenyl-diphosphatase